MGADFGSLIKGEESKIAGFSTLLQPLQGGEAKDRGRYHERDALIGENGNTAMSGTGKMREITCARSFVGTRSESKGQEKKS